jgi:hypothetical protein
VFTITFGISPPATPLTHIHPNDDFWFGIGMGPGVNGNWPTDGLAPHMAFNYPAGNTGMNSLDVVGPRITDITTNLSCFVQTSLGAGALPTGPAVYPANTTGGYRQLRLDILAQTTGGVAVTQTNQIRYPSSNPFANPTAPVPQGGTTNMLSGLHPDINDDTGLLPPPAGAPPRADDIGFVVTERNRLGSLVVVRMAFAPLSGGINPDGSIPVIFVPGFGNGNTRGNLCVDLFDPSAFTFIGFSHATTGVFQQMFGLTPPARAIIDQYQPIDFIWQGFVVNLAASPIEVKATGCVTHHL